MWYLYGVFILLLLVLFTFAGIKVGGDDWLDRRMKKERNMLGKLKYEIIIDYSNDTPTMVVKKKKDDGENGKDDEDQEPEQYTITIPNTYPFGGILTVNGVDFRVSEPIKTITDYIEEYKIPRVLIYCHPTSVNIYKPNDDPNMPNPQHWQNNIIYDQITKAGVSDPTKTVVWCVDNEDQHWGNNRDYSRVIKEDGFDDDFVNARKSWYTTIAIPDCGGEWYDHGSVDKWAELIFKASVMLAPGGTLIAGKFVDRNGTVTSEETASAAVAGKLKENHGENFDIETFQLNSLWFVTLKKK
jgi:hypothetical protein